MSGMKPAAIITDSKLVLMVNGRTVNLPVSDPNFSEAAEAVRNGDYERAFELADKEKIVRDAAEVFGNIKVSEGVVLFRDTPIHHVVVDKILKFKQNNLPFAPLAKYLDKLFQNPSMRARREHYIWLEKQDLPITEDGDCIGYKAVNADYTDCHTSTIDNHIGAVIEMPRNEVNDDFGLDCAEGFHIGSLDYAGPNGSFMNSDGHSMIVKYNPRDVVSVPESGTYKIRVSKYEVIGEATEPLRDNNLFRESFEGELDEYFGNGDPEDDLDDDLDDDFDGKSDNSSSLESTKPEPWKEVLETIMVEEGFMTLERIYAEVLEYFPENTRTKNWRASVRRTLQEIGRRNKKGQWKLKVNLSFVSFCSGNVERMCT